jgi:uncharacterized membrane protein
MEKKRRHLLVFGLATAIVYVFWKLVLSLLINVRESAISSLDWVLLITSFITLLVGEMGIFTGQRYGFYVLSIFLLSLFIETVLLRIPLVVYISFPLFIFGAGYLAYLYSILKKQGVDEVPPDQGEYESK